jgi:hypothetical protein
LPLAFPADLLPETVFGLLEAAAAAAVAAMAFAIVMGTDDFLGGPFLLAITVPIGPTPAPTRLLPMVLFKPLIEAPPLTPAIVFGLDCDSPAHRDVPMLDTDPVVSEADDGAFIGRSVGFTHREALCMPVICLNRP